MSGNSGYVKRNGIKKAKEVAKNFHEMGLDVEKIAQGTGYPLDTVKEWLLASKNS